jgi:predicted nucleic acid-binding protein
MQEKVVIDTCVYIDLFNKGLYKQEINGFEKVMYLAHPVLHELWIGAKGKRERDHLNRFVHTFIKVKRLIVPEPSTQVRIGRVCNKLYHSGKLNPKHPKIYNDICIAMLTRQIGATLLTRNLQDFDHIREVTDFKYREAKP